MRSIMQKKDGTCYLCRRLYGDDSQKATQEHHAIYGHGRRKLSERYGLKVYLCVPHHTVGPAAVHNSQAMAGIVKRDAQVAFEERHSRGRFMEVFGRNYLDRAAGLPDPESRTDDSAGTGSVSPGFRWLSERQKEDLEDR